MSMLCTPRMEWPAPAAPTLPLFQERHLRDIIQDYRLDAADQDHSVIELAERDLRLIGVGDHASVFEHPDDDALIIRLTDYPDGWYAYAAQVMDLQRAHGLDSWMRFAPVVHDIAISDHQGIYIAVVERLRHHEDEGSKRLINLVRRTRDLDSWSSHYAEAIEQLESEQPGISRFIETFRRDLTDLHPGNIMFRGRTLIFNDPRGRPLTDYEIIDLDDQFGF